MKYMNKRLIKALERAFIIEETNKTQWSKDKRVSQVQLSMLSKRGLRSDALKEICKESNWQFPQTSIQICIACINDFIEEKLGRKPTEFSVRQAEHKANAELENNIEIIENFAKSSQGAVELIATLANIIKGTIPADEIESVEASKKSQCKRKQNA